MLNLEDEPLLDTESIQGNILRGFDTQWLELIGLKMNDADRLSTWLNGLGPMLSSLAQVHEYRLARSAGTIDNAHPPILVNAAISGRALRLLGFDTGLIGEGLLNLPMGALHRSLGDRPEDVAGFKVGGNAQSWPEVLLLLGCENRDALTARSNELVASAAQAGATVIYRETGGKLPGEAEHFGFRDGISQVGVRGLLSRTPAAPLTLRRLSPDDPKADALAAPGQPLVWPGQFVFGYPTQQENNVAPGPPSGGTDWLRNGSLLAFRRLSQDVRAFRDFTSETATQVNLAPDVFAAKVVGRWPDGTPVLLSPTAPDAAIASDAEQVNHFAFNGMEETSFAFSDGHTRTMKGLPTDFDGHVCPHFSHIRKVNPRNLQTDRGGEGRTLMMQMMRRGIPFGPPFDGAETETPERGLFFLSYQVSFDKQFNQLSALWMNNPDAPEGGMGKNHDLLVGQAPVRTGSLPGGASFETPKRWVIPTGGAFLFTPSISFFNDLPVH